MSQNHQGTELPTAILQLADHGEASDLGVWKDEVQVRYYDVNLDSDYFLDPHAGSTAISDDEYRRWMIAKIHGPGAVYMAGDYEQIPASAASRFLIDMAMSRWLTSAKLPNLTHWVIEDKIQPIDAGSWPKERFGEKEREAVKDEIDALLQCSGEENWDDDGALPLDRNTVEVAKDVVDEFPSHIMPPDVAVTPHGELDFDWVVAREVMLTISIGPLKEVAFSGLFPGTRLKGRQMWSGALPAFVEYCFEQLVREAHG